jgi:DNA-directed RNA polymerase specialized sigma24 family protein
VIPDSADRYAQLARALNAIRANPREAAGWTLFYEQTAPRLRAQFFMLGVRDKDRIDDLTQETLARFLQYGRWHRDWRKLPAAPEVMAYLRKIARRVTIDAHRRLAAAGTPAGGAADFDRLPGSAADLQPVLERMAKALGPADRLFLRLLLQGRRLEDIAELLGISYGAAGLRKHRLLKKMEQI